MFVMKMNLDKLKINFNVYRLIFRHLQREARDRHVCFCPLPFLILTLIDVLLVSLWINLLFIW